MDTYKSEALSITQDDVGASEGLAGAIAKQTVVRGCVGCAFPARLLVRATSIPPGSFQNKMGIASFHPTRYAPKQRGLRSGRLSPQIVPCPDGRNCIYFYHSHKVAAMHLNIKNDEAHKLASELARLTGA